MQVIDRFCPHCKTPVDASTAHPACSNCGRNLLFSLCAPTVDLTDPASYDEKSGNSITADEGFAKQLVGRKIGLYRIESLLGKGGMAWVFLGWHESLQRPCALKVLCPELLGRQADSLDLFIAEARNAASLVHPSIVAIHNVGELESHHFIEMEYVAGCSLDNLVSDTSLLSPVEVTSYLLQASSALVAAHRKGLVHRDFKPANILVRSDGIAKLADFGLAKNLAIESTSRQSNSGLSSSGDGRLMGTPQFMSPELFRGEPANQQSDIYAVGVSYFYALTGKFPFSHTTILGIAKCHAEQDIPDARSLRDEIPGDAATLIAKCLAKNPKDRFADSAAMLQVMQNVFGGMRDLRSLVTRVLAESNIDIQSSMDQIVANVWLANGRRQKVYLEFCPASSSDSRLIRIYSVCAPVDNTYLRRALEFNATMSHGALAIQNINGEPHFIMLNSYLQATCEAEDIRRSVQEVAQWADDVEKLLTGRDDR